MTDEEKNNDNYELPMGISLPKDAPANYPNWGKGLIFAIPGGFFFAFAFWLLFVNKATGTDYRTSIIGFIMGFLVLGAIVAFRPPKN
ncbi:MAG: hypothetical protein KOO69_00190 [Victivallales bacterium]|nr:hypothetical protein [Victivallales bacterium]